MDAPQKPATIMTVMHRVKNFAKWKASYDEHDAMRLASGLHNYVIGRGAEDTNMVMVAVMADDVNKAKAFAADTSLKTAMQAGGVVGPPTIHMISIQWMETADISSALRLRATYKVKDWDAWKKAFNANKQVRIDNGMIDRAYGYDVDDNHNVTLVMAVVDPVKAKAFMKSDLLKQKMTESGVVGSMEKFMYNIVQKY